MLCHQPIISANSSALGVRVTDLAGDRDGLGVVAKPWRWVCRGGGRVGRWDGGGQEPVEVADALLAARLAIRDGRSEHLTVEDRAQVARFVRGIDGKPEVRRCGRGLSGYGLRAGSLLA